MAIRRISYIYGALYVALAAADLGSTLLGQETGAREFNPAVADANRIDIARFVVLNALFGIVVVGMLNWALAHGGHAKPGYIRAPWRASLSWLTYANPFASRNQPKSVFHWLAIPISLLFVRAFAVGNNLAIAFGIPDVLTPVAHWVANQVPKSLVYPAVVTLLVAPFWLAGLYLVPRLLRWGNGAPVTKGSLARDQT